MVKTLKKFFSFLLRRKRAFSAFFLTALAAAVLSSLSPYLYKLLVDSVSLKNYSLLFQLILLFAGLKITANFLSTMARYLGDKVAIPTASQIREKIFHHVQELDFAFHANKKTGSLISVFKRGSGAFWSLFLNLFEIFKTGVGLLVVLFFFSRLSYWLLLVMAGLFVANGLASYFLIRANVRRRQEVNEVEDRVSAVIADNFLNYETVKYFAGEERERKRLGENLKDLIEKAWAYGNTFRFMDLSIGTFSAVGMFLILWLTLGKLRAGEITSGDLVMIASFTTSFYFRFFSLLYKSRSIAKHFIDLKRYFGLLSHRSRVRDPAQPVEIEEPKGEIVFEEVTFNYPEGKEGALQDFSLRVKAGETMAFVGRSGAGKTTLVKLLFRLYNLDRGRILIDGTDIKKLRKKDLRKMVGIVPQEPILFNESIGFNITFAEEGASREKTRRVTEMANLLQFVESLPRKFGTRVGERGIKLSGGQKQRLAIARMLLEDPKIIIFDEATSQLDSESEMLVKEALWRVAEGRTVLIIAHRFSTLRNADRIAVLQDGRLKEKGAHPELIKKEGLYKYLWDLQTKDDTFSDTELS